MHNIILPPYDDCGHIRIVGCMAPLAEGRSISNFIVNFRPLRDLSRYSSLGHNLKRIFSAFQWYIVHDDTLNMTLLGNENV